MSEAENRDTQRDSRRGSAPERSPEFTRRTVLEVLGAGSLAALAPLVTRAAPGEKTAVLAEFEKLVPADKKLDPAWVKSLTERGAPEVLLSDSLKFIGMPVGGIGCGQLYLAGDGRLWCWDILRPSHPADVGGELYLGPRYAAPVDTTNAAALKTASIPGPRGERIVEHGFAIRVRSGEKSIVKTLDRSGFSEITFRGEYPIGRVTYHDAAMPVDISLEAFSPFIPLNLDDSSLPATVLAYTVKNTASAAVEVELAGWIENPVCREGSQGLALERRNILRYANGNTALECDVQSTAAVRKDPRPDIVFEDWTKKKYEDWKVQGSAFGEGPISKKNIPEYQGDVGGDTERVANSHATAPGKSVVERDGALGRLTSKWFTIERDFIYFFIGGGGHAGKTCLNLRVDGKLKRTATGRNDNRMALQSFDVHDLAGKDAVLELVDNQPGPWGNIGLGKITFSDNAPKVELRNLPGYGSLTLLVRGREGATPLGAAIVPPGPADLEKRFTGLKAGEAAEPLEAHVPVAESPMGAVGQKFTLKPGESATVEFILSWWFPYYVQAAGELAPITEGGKLARHYVKRFKSAREVGRYVSENFTRLAGETRRWNATWYDSTLPYWLLDRTVIPLDCLATQTLHGFENGRWWGWEGVDCCPGTCQHVWHYAQAAARLFPSLERDLRERVDFGLAWHESGAIDYRGENARHVAHDGFCGTIVRAWREHTLCENNEFLKRIWPRVKKSLEYIVAEDKNADGILEGVQMNTLDAPWEGPMGWISSVYLAALAAGAAMAREMNDIPFAERLQKLRTIGSENLVKQTFDGEFFIHRPPNFKRTNTNQGCHIDQVLGQSLAFSAGLARVVPQPEAKSALAALWKYNFSPDIGVYRMAFKTIPGGRWYAVPGEAGLLMCTWPNGGAEHAPGGGNATFVGYFNECMTGFEYQVASHMVWEGLVTEGLAVTRAIHDRYAPAKRNPYNEVECSDHYSRAMASYGVFLGACGFEHHGPQGKLSFAPRVSPENFKAPFTTAVGWGTYSQTLAGGKLAADLQLKWGKLHLRTLALTGGENAKFASLKLSVNGKQIAATLTMDGPRAEIKLAEELLLKTGESLKVELAA